MSVTENKYLIRSAREILGPYTKEEVVDLIRKGKISIFDEVTEPFEIWMGLQDHKEFKPVVQSIDMQTRITNFLTDISNKITKTKKIEKTKTQTLSSTDTHTTKVSGRTNTVTLTQQEKDSASEVDFNVMDKSSARSAKKSSPYSSKQENEEKVRRKIGFFVKLSWRVIILSALVILSFIAYQVVYKPFEEKNLVLQELNLKGLPLYQKGDYTATIPYFERARELLLLNDEQKILYSALLLQQNKSQKAYLLKQEILDPNLLNSGEGLLLSALIDFYDEDYQQASLSFHKVLSNSSNRDLTHKALINLAILYREQKEYQKSTNTLNDLLNQGVDWQIIYYLKAINLLYQERWTDLENFIKDELYFLPIKDSIVVEFKQELILMLAYLEMKKQNSEQLKDYILKFFNEDPLMYQNYNYHPLIAVNRLNWRLLFFYCREIFNFQPDDKLSRALYAFCLFKREQFDQADSELTRLTSSEPQNPLFLSLQAYFLMDKEPGRDEDIEQIFSLIGEQQLEQNRLAFILKAHFLSQQMDWEASLDLWKKLLAKEPKHLSALVGVAISSYELQEPTRGETYLQQALGLYPYHKKLLRYKK